MDVTIAVCTYGDDAWRELAHSRALPSAVNEGPAVYRHGTTLAEARNAALAAVTTEFIIYLDADDELTPGYVAAMARGRADIRACAVQYVTDGKHGAAGIPRVNGSEVPTPSLACLLRGNWIAIGAAARTAVLRKAGGWREWPMYEDWELWLRCMRAGAAVEAIPDAVYRAHVRAGSRNRALPHSEKLRVRREILAAIRGAP